MSIDTSHRPSAVLRGPASRTLLTSIDGLVTRRIIDLPLKILVWEDADGQCWVSFDDPVHLAARHHVPAALVANIGVVESLVDLALAQP